MTPPTALGVPATLGRRVGAYLIDAAIAGAVFLVPWLTFVVIIAVAGGSLDLAGLAALVWTAYGVVTIVVLAWAVVYTLMQARRGSIGQRAVGIRIGDAATAEPIGFGRALVRNIIWGLAGSIVVGYFSPLFDSSARRQGWHDKVARAVMLDRRATEAAIAEAERPAPPAPPKPNPFLPPPPAAVPVADPVVPGAASLTGPVAPPVAPMAGFAPPAGSTPAAVPPVAQSGIISGVPGFGAAEAPATPAAAQAPPATGASAATAPAVDPADADEIDATRAAPAPRGVLTWDDGTRVAIYGRTLFGRNPAAEDDAVVVAVRDETLSLSKTHFEILPDHGGVWVIDRHSTNGTVLVRGDARTPVEPGRRHGLQTADVLEFGDRRAVLGRVS